MKKEYVTPRIYGEEFIANEYVAACYKIKCTTPNGNKDYYYLYDDTNGNGRLDSKDELIYYYRFMGGFYGCNKWHKGVIRDSAPEVNGFVTKKERDTNNAEPVFWWEEKLGSSSDYHVMVPGAENYETNPNAS